MMSETEVSLSMSDHKHHCVYADSVRDSIKFEVQNRVIRAPSSVSHNAALQIIT